MSWPTDGKPRFKVASVTGYNSGGGSGDAKLVTVYTVLDRALGHRIAWSYGPHARWPIGYEAKARAVAAELEAAHA